MGEKLVEIIKKWGKSDIRNGIAVLFVLACLAFLFLIVIQPVPDKNNNLINILGGNIIAGLSLILGYYFGSSKSDVKTDDKE